MRYLILLLLLLWHAMQLKSQTSFPILDRKVTIKITNQPLAKVLNIISETAEFNFSYGNNINVNRLVTIHAENRTVKEVLDQLFIGQVSYQQIGNHLILQRKIIPKNSSQIQGSSAKPNKYKYMVSGYIRDLYSGNGIINVSVYEKSSLSSTLSGDFGYYELPVTSKENNLSVHYNILGYVDTTILITFNNSGAIDININLKSKTPLMQYDETDILDSTDYGFHIMETDTTTIAPKDSTKTILAWDGFPLKRIKVSETQFGQWFINSYQRLSEKNIQDSFYRDWQFTLIPPIGSNGRLSGLVTNRFSLNAFVGYNGGVDGAEFGGFLNIVKREMHGVQFAGFGNIVGRQVHGAQFAGFFNHNFGDLDGFQGAGFYNFNHGNAYGVQAAGFFNSNLKNLDGIQAAGFVNFNLGSMKGAQVAGFVNTTLGDANGLQAAGFVNFARAKSNLVQVAGFVNIANEIDGGQIAGFVNIAKKVRGFQIGIMNIADSAEGVTIGLINFIRTGLHQIELSRNENNYGFAYRSGTRKFYSVAFINSNLPIKDSATLMSYGWGVGTSFKLAKPLYITVDATSQHLTFNFISDHLNLQNKLNANIEFKVIKGLALFGGASLNYLIADTRDYHYKTHFENYGTKAIWHQSGTYDQHVWLGYQFGVRLF